jgi:glycosyltransferase involved in cell wall biosynthesis
MKVNSMTVRARVLYIVPPSPVFAGIEGVVTDVADEIAREYGEALDVHVLYCARYPEITAAARSFSIHYLEAGRLRVLFWQLTTFLRSNQFDLVIPAQCELSLLVSLALTGRSTRVVPFFHGNPAIEERSSYRSRVAFQLYRMFAGPRAAGALCVSRKMADYVAHRLPSRGPTHFVPNPVRDFAKTERLRNGDKPFTILSVGRLSRQKAQDVLLKAYARARKDMPASRLVLVGGGSELASLRALSGSLGIEQWVEIVGRHVDPTPYLQQADCFALASRWEGFGVVLLEALAFGLPLVVTDCNFGPQEIVSDERIGIIARVENIESFAAALVTTSLRVSTTEDEAYRRAQVRTHSKAAAGRRHFEVLSSLLGQRDVHCSVPAAANRSY